MKARIEADPNDAEAHLVLSQVYQARITGTMSGMRFGRRAGETLDRALELAPGDPRPIYLKGSTSSWRRAPSGTGRRRGATWRRRWRASRGCARGGLLVGRAGGARLPRSVPRAENERDQARAAYERALELEPGFEWVRERLLPDLESP